MDEYRLVDEKVMMLTYNNNIKNVVSGISADPDNDYLWLHYDIDDQVNSGIETFKPIFYLDVVPFKSMLPPIANADIYFTAKV